MKNENVVSKTVQGEEILLNLDTGIYFGLNETGTFVWQKICEGISSDELTTSLSKQYGISTKQAQTDINELVSQFKEHKLIRL